VRSTLRRTGTPRRRSAQGLLSAATGDVSHLVRQEIELAKAETKEELRTAARAGAMFGAAAVVGFLALLLALFAAAWGLAEVMPAGVAFLIVALVAGAVAFCAFTVGRERFKHFDPVPQQTAETIKEDVEWFKTRKN
jgi:fatty acid desaturase